MSNVISPQAWKLAASQKQAMIAVKANLSSAITTDSDIHSKLPHAHTIYNYNLCM